ncbi:MAG: sigma 54-interacting transcriptional regulator [Woeseiaceae bacterium]|nr:sigma 54-interacting transcriptional regulator [Woeseiaceae bacterium]
MRAPRRGTLLALLSLALLATSTIAYAVESRSVRFQHLSRDDGLSQAFVYDIVQDPRGFMWFGTQEGLNRWDGYTFTVFAHDPADANSISDESVRTLLIDSNGTLWIGTDAGGLSRYNQHDRSFTNFVNDPGDPQSIADNRVRVVYEDTDGLIWVGTDGAGLDRFDPQTGKFEHFPHDIADPGSIASPHIWDVLRDSRGVLWIATTNGLSRFDDTTGTFRNYRHDPANPQSLNDNELRVLFEDADGHFWIGTTSGGLNRMDTASGGFEHFTHDPGDSSSITDNRINAIFQDDAGLIWIGTLGGLNAWRTDGSGFDRYTNDASDRYSLGHDNALSLFQDDGGVLWVGTYDGISRWNQRNRFMKHFRADASGGGGLSQNTVTTFAEAPDGSIWIGTYGGGLNRLNREASEISVTRHVPGDTAGLPSDRIMALYGDADGGLWVGTRRSGLAYRDAATGLYETFTHDPADASSLSANGITYLLRDSQGALWVATFGGGLNRFDEASRTFERFEHDPTDPDSISNDRLMVLFEDSQGILWVGTYGGALNSFDRASGKFTRYRDEPGRYDGLASNEILMIEESADGDLWISVKGAGLNRWRRNEREAGRLSFVRYGEIDGLPSNTIYSGIWDGDGFLWMSTARGLTRLDPRRGTFRNYDTSHGLQNDEFNMAAGFGAADGELFFGGINGFNAFYPEEFTNHRAPPRVVITRVDSMGEPVDTSSEDIRLNHDQNVVSFEFAALDFAAPRKNQFRYKLEGVDKAWVEAGHSRYVTYSNVPAGDFKFLVIAANNDGIWSDFGATVSFSRAPAPWLTWWAFSAYAIAILGVLWLLIRGYNRRQQQETMLAHAEEIRLVQARLQEAQRIAGVGNWVWRIDSGEQWWSDEMYHLLGLDAETTQPSYKTLLQQIHPDDRPAYEEAVERSLDDGEPFDIEYRVRAGAGKTAIVQERCEVTVNNEGEPVRVVGTINDITERKTAEDNIRRRADFQSLCAELSSRLLQTFPNNFEQQLSECLAMVGQQYGVDAITINLLDTEQEYLRSRFSWQRSHDKRRAKPVEAKQVPWMTSQLIAGKPIIIRDVADMPEEARADQQILQNRGTQSLLDIPLIMDDQLGGTCAFSHIKEQHDWRETTVSELTLIAGILASAIARHLAAAEIQKLNENLWQENISLREEVRIAHSFDEIIGEDLGLRRCLSAVEKVAPTDAAVLILGETGTGKELLARAVHKLSPRADKSMISVNCPALPANLIESELFGHEKGAFTGAESQRLGRFENADGSTIFLDEVGELPLDLQAKLLRVLQTGEFERLGGTETLKTDVRLVAATNRNLPEEIEHGDFRSDLYYRIGSFPITLPPLRERRGDIPLLAEYFVRKHAKRLGRDIDAISARTMKQLMSYDWPGNIRELESIIERALITANGSNVLELPHPLGKDADRPLTGTAQDTQTDLESVERSYIIDVLDSTNWKISGDGGAAEILGMPSSTLRSKMKRLGIEREQR